MRAWLPITRFVLLLSLVFIIYILSALRCRRRTFAHPLFLPASRRQIHLLLGDIKVSKGKKTIVLGRGEIDFYSSDDSPYIGNDTNSTQEESPADVAAAAAESSEYKNPPIDQLAGM